MASVMGRRLFSYTMIKIHMSICPLNQVALLKYNQVLASEEMNLN